MYRMIRIKVLFFASAREAIDKESIDIDMETNSTTSDLLKTLIEICPILTRCDMRLAVNKKYINSEVVLNDRDEVACIPPISGG